ncbi:hypothetical protein [Streptomyces sp. C3-3]|uniref:hypothetical protein n=1 Tax=Streptomyces sp. C3-3 TaxID=2824901 RepID=UPI001FFD6EC6|nr:hypothetical protein [Streptomyces sp. C3-3]
MALQCAPGTFPAPLLAPLLAATLLLTGCGAGGGRTADVRDAAVAFQEGLRTKDAAATCALLAPATRDTLELSEGKPCVTVIAGEELPVAGSVRGVDVYGNQGRAVFDGDTLFLSRFPDGWKVVAGGCTPDPARPYTCVVEGG